MGHWGSISISEILIMWIEVAHIVTYIYKLFFNSVHLSVSASEKYEVHTKLLVIPNLKLIGTGVVVLCGCICNYNLCSTIQDHKAPPILKCSRTSHVWCSFSSYFKYPCKHVV